MAQLFECDKCGEHVKDSERWQVRLEVTQPGGQPRFQLGGGRTALQGTASRTLDLCETCADELIPIVTDDDEPTDEDRREARIRRLERQLGVGNVEEPAAVVGQPEVT